MHILFLAEILGNDINNTESNYNNPMTYEEFTTSGLMQDTIPVKWDTPVESWGGKTLRQIGVNQEKPIQEVYYNYDGGYVYFYLNFSDNGSASSFMNEYYQKNPQMKKNVDQYLAFYFEWSGFNWKEFRIYMNDSHAICCMLPMEMFFPMMEKSQKVNYMMRLTQR